MSDIPVIQCNFCGEELKYSGCCITECNIILFYRCPECNLEHRERLLESNQIKQKVA